LKSWGEGRQKTFINNQTATTGIGRKRESGLGGNHYGQQNTKETIAGKGSCRWRDGEGRKVTKGMSKKSKRGTGKEGG